MRRLSIYTFGLSAGIAGFFAALFGGSIGLEMQKPLLSWFVIAISVVFALAGAGAASLATKTAGHRRLGILAGVGAMLFSATQVFFWKAVLH